MTRILNWQVFTVCSLLPLYILRFEFFGIPTTLLEILILGLFLFWFVVRGLSANSWGELFILNEFFYPIVFFLLTAVVATIFSYDKNGALGILKAYFLEPVLLFLVVSERAKVGFGNFAFYGLVFAAFWLSVLAIFQKITGLAIPGDAVNEILQGRVIAVYNSANSLAHFLGPTLAVSLGWFLVKFKSFTHFYYFWLVILVLFIQLLAIILTKSQAGMLATLGVFTVFFLGKYLRLKKFLPVFYSILVLLVFLNFLFPILAFFGINFGEIFGDETLNNRFYLWKGTVNLVLDRPLFGAGLDGFRELYGQSYRFSEYDELVQYPHNLILNFWSELGVFGVVAFFWLLIIFIKKAWKNKFCGWGFLAATVYILIHGIFDVPYFKNDLSAQFFILLALTKFKEIENYKQSFAGLSQRKNVQL